MGGESIKNYHTFAADEDKKTYGTLEKRDEAIDKTVNEVERNFGKETQETNGQDSKTGRPDDSGRRVGENSLFQKVKARTVLNGFKETGEMNVTGLKINSPRECILKLSCNKIIHFKNS